MAPPPPSIPGFTTLSDQVFLYEPSALEGAPPPSATGPPSTVLIFGWGDAQPKHLAKYTAAYQQMYPLARIVVVLSPMMRTLYAPQRAIEKSLLPALRAVGADDRVLVHAFSNSGSTNFIMACEAYRRENGNARALPHKLLVLDSTPGGHHVWTELARWSVGMAAGLGPFLPIPHKLTVALCGAWIILTVACTGWMGIKSRATQVCESLVNKLGEITTPGAHRLAVYSKEDEIIGYKELEEQGHDWEKKGWPTTLECFEGSQHVSHMRTHPEKYWAVVRTAWDRAVGASAEQEQADAEQSGVLVDVDTEKSGVLVDVDPKPI